MCRRMTWFAVTTTTLLLLLIGTLCVSSSVDQDDTLEVLYPQKTFNLTRGSSVTLSCKVSYNFNKCNQLHVVWQNVTEGITELTDPSKYFTTENETISDGNKRLKQVDTKILNLAAGGKSQFQCKAECGKGESAMGHFIYINVKDSLQVLYSKKTFNLIRGSSVTLSCKVSYDFNKCDLLHVVWQNATEGNTELTDPSKYLTTVNETISDGNIRLRQVDTKILSVTADHNGQFQCKANCDDGASEMGHIIIINVKD